MKLLGRSLALAVGLVISSGASAQLIGLYGDEDTSAYNIPSNNDFLPAGLPGFIGGHLFNSTLESILVTYEFLNKEATFNNQFYVGGAPVFSTDSTAPGATVQEVVAGSGFLDFSFLTGSGFTADNDPESADQNSDERPYNFYIYFNEEEDAYYLALDDGHVVDDNHDDMLIRITAIPDPGQEVPVPEPASAALMGLGLLGAGLVRRRKQA